jgi:CAAX prenyl protease-like protein
MSITLTRPLLARVIPFVLFMALLALRGQVPADGSWGIDPRWIYGLTVLVVGAALAYFWRDYVELGSASAPGVKGVALAVAVGLVVFVLWINLDAPWMTLGEPAAAFRPVDEMGQLDWSLVVVRLIGAALLVPVMEELFWRSFLMRWVDNPQFMAVDPRQASLKAVVLSTAVFTLAHTLWLAAIIASLAYAWLYRYTGSLWVAVLAHSVTNLALGVWVVWTGHWAFW